MEPKHSVIVFTYNQQDTIKRALESLLCQKELIYEIIIADDCSTDNNWSLITEYKNKYPELIKSYRHSKNQGIFGNIESTWDKTSGNIIWYLAGDDIYCDGLFCAANKLIKKHNIDIENEAFTLYFDYKSISTKGKERIFRNNLVEKYNPISLKIRQLICNRTTGISKKVLNQFYPVRKDIGIMADGLLDIQTQIFSEKSYYTKFIGSIYYTNIGISSITKKEDSNNSYIKSLDQMKLEVKQLSESDIVWIEYLKTQLLFDLNKSYKLYLKYLKLYFKILIPFYGINFIYRETKLIVKASIKIKLLYLKKMF